MPIYMYLPCTFMYFSCTFWPYFCSSVYLLPFFTSIFTLLLPNYFLFQFFSFPLSYFLPKWLGDRGLFSCTYTPDSRWENLCLLITQWRTRSTYPIVCYQPSGCGGDRAWPLSSPRTGRWTMPATPGTNSTPRWVFRPSRVVHKPHSIVRKIVLYIEFHGTGQTISIYFNVSRLLFCSKLCPFKGAQAWDFRLRFFSSKEPIWSPDT